ncbi:MAG: hypothetical protein ACFB9M_20290 [Myxococcota bacterium]
MKAFGLTALVFFATSCATSGVKTGATNEDIIQKNPDEIEACVRQMKAKLAGRFDWTWLERNPNTLDIHTGRHPMLARHEPENGEFRLYGFEGERPTLRQTQIIEGNEIVYVFHEGHGKSVQDLTVITACHERAGEFVVEELGAFQWKHEGPCWEMKSVTEMTAQGLVSTHYVRPRGSEESWRWQASMVATPVPGAASRSETAERSAKSPH